LFFNEAPENDFIKPAPKMDEEQKQLMITELQRMNLTAANQILKDLE